MAKWLAREGARVAVADSRASPPNAAALQAACPGVKLSAGGFARQAFDGIDLMAISPGVALAEPEVSAAMARGVPVAGDIELFARALARAPQHTGKLIGVTGSNGKTTVTAMAGAMCAKAGLRTAVAGNIGPAVLDVWMDAQDRNEYPQAWVLELSSFQLETTATLNLDAAAMLNLSQDHLDRYSGVEAYAAAKARVFHGTGAQILNRDDPASLAMRIPGRTCLSFGMSEPGSANDWGTRKYEGVEWLVQGASNAIRAADVHLSGRHNLANALAALALTRAIGLPLAPLTAALAEFAGLPHRMQNIGSLRGVSFFDDSKGTNVGATVAALKGMTVPTVLIAGGEGKGQNFSPLENAVAFHARAVVLLGRDADLIAAALAGSGIPLLRAATMEDAVSAAFNAAAPGDAVLLSPACASFDMFRNYGHRAEVFIAAANKLGVRLGSVH